MRPRPLRLHDHREFPVLYVDDEVENLRIFELTFRREFSVLTATSAEQGMQLLNDNPVAVVLSDHKMPGMTGVEFLSRVREIDDHAIRILVTAYGDAETLGSAINDGRIYRYVAKPWDPEDMRSILRRAIERHALDRERDALLHELTLINRLSRSLHRELDPAQVVERLLGAAHDELGFDGAAVLFFGADRRELHWAGIVPRDEVSARLSEIRFTRETARAFLETIESGATQALEVDEMHALEAPVREWVAEVSADEILVVPLVGQDEVIGALAMDNRSGGRRFGADDRTLLDGLATQAVIALENARTVEALRSSRAQVQRADRLGTLGTLAAGLAHEINNPLVSLHTFLSLAPRKREEDDPEFWSDYHALASAELERIRDLVETMQRLGRGDDDARPQAAVDVGALAREVAALVEREAAAAGVAIEVGAGEGVPKICAVRAQIHQVLLNLVLNAIHASPAGEAVQIEIAADDAAAPPGVVVEVCDRGSGIAAENLERIFDPFFTTKEPNEGTGLGLMISHQIVAQHGGSIEVESAPGRGARFRVHLPAEAPAATGPAA